MIPVRHARPVVLLSDVTIRYGPYSESPINISSDEESVVLEVAEVAPPRFTAAGRDSADSGSDKRSVSGGAMGRSEHGDLRRSPRIRMAAVPVVTTAELACRVSQHNLRSQVKCGYEEVEDTEEVMDYINGVADSSSSSSSSEEQEEVPPRPKLRLKTRTTSCSSDGSSLSDNSTDSDDCPNVRQLSESARNETRRSERAHLKPSPQTPKDPKPVGRNTRSRPAPKPAVKPAPAAARKAVPRKAVARKRRRPRKRRQPSSPPPLFAPGEPDPLLKYTQLREGRRRSRVDDFQPFVHVGKRSCTVVNHQEEDSGAGPEAPPGPVPGTTCYRLGRLGSRSRGRPPGACCLCGRSANALGLGDLHGPYYPVPPLPQGGVLRRHSPPPPDAVGAENYTPSTENAEREPRLKTERTEVHACGGNGGGFCPVTMGDRGVHGEWEEEGGGDADEDDRSSVMVVDSPCVPAEATWRPEEWWVHEDCGVWATGVFLVRGRLYGLKEAARVTRDVVSTARVLSL